MIPQKSIDEIANLYNKTKNPIYCDLWYKAVKERYGRVSKLSNTLSDRHERNKFTLPETARANDFVRLRRFLR